MASDFSIKYGDKFADGSRTLMYSKIAEPVYVDDHEALREEFKEFKQNTDNNIRELDNRMFEETDKLSKKIDNTMGLTQNHIHVSDVKFNMIWMTIFAIMQTWPMRFLNFFFKWWTYKVIDYSAFHNPTSGEVTIYVMPIIRGPKTRKEQIEFEKEYKNKIKDIKKYFTETTKGNVKLKYTIKPMYPDIK